MDSALPSIHLTSLLVAFAPTLILVALMKRWKLSAFEALYANARMLAQLLLVGYVLTYIFETEEPLVVIAVFILMLGAAAWIAMASLFNSVSRPRRSVILLICTVMPFGVGV